MKLEDAIKTLSKELNKDKSPGSYYDSWKANIATCFMDSFTEHWEKDAPEEVPQEVQTAVHKIANSAAVRFIHALTSDL